MAKARRNSRILLVVGLSAVILFLIFFVLALIGSRAIFSEIQKLVPAESRRLEFSKADDLNNAFVRNDDSGQDLKILQISDTHICASVMTVERDKAAVRAIASLVYTTQPDFIVVTGDMVYTIFFNGTINNFIAVQAVSEIFEAFEIPWTVTFGNHDDDITTIMKLKEQAEYYQQLPHCLFSAGSEDIEGVGNYIVEMQNNDGSLNTALFMFDCNGYGNLCSRYDYVRDGQVNWYTSQLEKLSKDYSKPVTSLIFVHIPLYEYKIVQKLVQENHPSVTLLRGVCEESISSPSTDVGKLFDAILQAKSTVGVFCGHDHKNSFAIKYDGVVLAYGMSIDFVAYPRIQFRTKQRGGQIIELNRQGLISIALARQDNNYLPDQPILINSQL